MADTLVPGQVAIPAPRAVDPAPAPSAAAAYPLARHIQAQLDQGVHPATRAAIQQGTTCGTCVHAVAKQVDSGGARTRCELAVSRRGGPDVLPVFPGCDHHTPRTEASA